MNSRNRQNPRRRPVNTGLPEAAQPAEKSAQARPEQPQGGKQAATKAAPARPAAPKPVARPAPAAKPAPQTRPAPQTKAAPAAGAPAIARKPATAAPVAPLLKDAAVSVSDKDKSGKKKKDSGKKQKQVRDSFTLPEADYALFAQLKARCLAKGIEVKKSELLRAALRQLAGLDDVVLAAVMGEVEKIKTGRPSK